MCKSVSHKVPFEAVIKIVRSVNSTIKLRYSGVKIRQDELNEKLKSRKATLAEKKVIIKELFKNTPFTWVRLIFPTCLAKIRSFSSLLFAWQDITRALVIQNTTWRCYRRSQSLTFVANQTWEPHQPPQKTTIFGPFPIWRRGRLIKMSGRNPRLILHPESFYSGVRIR